MGVAGIRVSRYLKEELALAIDKQFQLQTSFRLSKQFSYLKVFENREVQRWLANRGSTVY